MARYKESNGLSAVKDFIIESLPKATDNIFRIIIKVIFYLCIIGILGSCVYLTGYFSKYYVEKKVINEEREISALEYGSLLLKQRNNEYVAWLNIENTELNNPIYQTDNNDFYLNHNSLRKKSDYGALFLDCRSDFTDKNIVIYGNTKEDGSLFSTLHNYRRVKYFKENPIISLTRVQKTYHYVAFAAFVMNSDASQDGGKMYNVYKKDFSNEKTFNKWIEEAKIRSLVNTEIDLSMEDNYLTLITSCDDFEGARLVVMARLLRENEKNTVACKYSINKNPKFPKKWYDDRNIEYIY